MGDLVLRASIETQLLSQIPYSGFCLSHSVQNSITQNLFIIYVNQLSSTPLSFHTNSINTTRETEVKRLIVDVPSRTSVLEVMRPLLCR